MLEAKLTLDLKPLQNLAAEMDKQLQRGGNGPLRKGFYQCAVVYRSFAQERFDRLSKSGGGEWPPLSPATIRARRKGRKLKIKLYGAAAKAHAAKRAKELASGGPAILRDKGLLFAALDPVFSAKPGALQQDLPNGIRVGFGGPGAHGNAKASIADIAGFHDAGTDHLPQRKIIVVPPENVMDRMGTILENALQEQVNAVGAQ